MHDNTYTRQASSLSVEQVNGMKARSGWSKKRKVYTAVIIAVAASVIAVAVAVPVVLTRRSRKQPASYEELWLPQGYRGTGLNGVVEGSWQQNKTYERLLVFGSSYSDNAHPRASQYSGSFAAEQGYYKQRWSNGPVWVEYLKDYLGSNVTHLNYAYAGATTNNSIHLTSVPDTSQQMATYMQEGYTRGVKSLVAMFTTTNDIMATFNNYLDSTNPLYHNNESAAAVISQSAQSLVNQLYTLIPANSSDVAPDYLILPILPVELTPFAKTTAREGGVNTNAVRDITRQYNAVLMDGARALAKRLGSRGNVYTYDVPSWFYSMIDDPSKYSLENVNVGWKQEGPGDVTDYLWYDRLHLTTHVQHQLARLSANMIFNTTVAPQFYDLSNYLDGVQ